MPLAFGVFTETSLRSALGLLVASSIKSTLVIALAALVVACLRRGPAALKHQVWAAGLAGALLMPVLTVSLPGWSVQGIPDWRVGLEGQAAPETMPAVHGVHGARKIGDGAQEAFEPQRVSVMRPSLSDNPLPPAGFQRAITNLPSTTQIPTTASPSTTTNPPGATLVAGPVDQGAPARSTPALPPLPVLIVALWFAGVAASLVLLVAGRWGLWRVARRARPVRDPALLAHAREAARGIGLDRKFDLLEGPADSVPVTWGIVKPVVLLPAGASEWPVEALRAVLIHELAHVARRDCLTQTLGQLARALYWFHPAVVFAERQLRSERERACDDRVLGAQVKASDYADQILDVVRHLRAGAWSTRAAVAFARRSSLEGRILALLDPGRDRRPSTMMGALRVTVAFAAVAAVLAVARPAEVAATSPTQTHGSLSTDLAPAESKQRMGAPAEVVTAPSEVSGLSDSWGWALENVEREARPEGDWVGYRVADTAAEDDRVLTDSGDIFVEFLSDEYGGPSLADALAGRAPGAAEKRGLAVLVHLTFKRGRGPVVDRLRAQGFRLPAELKGQRLLWLGDAGGDESVEWLQELDGGPLVARVQNSLIDAVSLHSGSESVVRFLESKAEGDSPDAVRAQAAEALARSASDEALKVLQRLAREDRSNQVRREAIESLGEIERDEATQILIEIARDDAESSQLRREAVEALGERVNLVDLASLQSLGDAAEAVVEAVSEAVSAELDAPKECATAEPGPCGVAHPTPASMITIGPMPPAAPTTTIMIGPMPAPPAPAAAPQAPQPPTAMMRGRDARKHRMLDRPGPGAPAPEETPAPDDEIDLQRNAVEALGRMPEALSLPKLIALVAEHPSLSVRQQAVESMGMLATEGAIGAIERLIWKSREVKIQLQAVDVMSRFPAEVAVRKLIPVASSHPVIEVRRSAIDCLGRFPEQSAVNALDQIIRSAPDMASRAQAIDAMSHQPHELALQRLAKLARSELPAALRRLAIEGLGRQDPEAALPVIEELLKGKKD